MKRGQTSIILFVLVVSIFAGGFIPTQPVSAYQALAPGDQLLYKNVLTFYEDLEQKLFHVTDVSPTADSWWIKNHRDYEYDEMESYSINSIDTLTGNVNYTWSYYDRYDNYYLEDHFYDYTNTIWELNTSYYDNSITQASDFSVQDYSVFDGVLNIDPTGYFSSAVFDRAELRYYVINGLNSSYNVDVYVYSYSDSINSPYSYYDITFQQNNPYGWYDEYYVDSSTGFLLGYSTIYYDNYYASFYKYCSDLGTWVDYYYNYTYTYEYTWLLYETTADYNPVSDADLPALIIDFGYEYNIRSDSDILPIIFDLYNSWPSMTIDVYLDGSYVESLYGLSPGTNVYNLDTKSIPVSTTNHSVNFVVYDDASFEHNTTWGLVIKDIRLDWPRFDGPVGELWYTVGDFVKLEWTIYDDFLNPNYYEFTFNSLVLSLGAWVDGFYLSLKLEDYITTAGDYFVTIYAVDLLGYESYNDLTIHASDTPDSTPPAISGPASTIYIVKGETAQLIWNIQDENPGSYTVKINGTVDIDTLWYIEDFNVIIDLNTLDVGTWFFELNVYDLSGNPNYASVYVVVTEENTEPTNPTDPTEPTTPGNTNTLTLDAPGIITTILGFISFVALVTLIRKRK